MADTRLPQAQCILTFRHEPFPRRLWYPGLSSMSKRLSVPAANKRQLPRPAVISMSY